MSAVFGHHPPPPHQCNEQQRPRSSSSSMGGGSSCKGDGGATTVMPVSSTTTTTKDIARTVSLQEDNEAVIALPQQQQQQPPSCHHPVQQTNSNDDNEDAGATTHWEQQAVLAAPQQVEPASKNATSNSTKRPTTTTTIAMPEQELLCAKKQKLGQPQLDQKVQQQQHVTTAAVVPPAPLNHPVKETVAMSAPLPLAAAAAATTSYHCSGTSMARPAVLVASSSSSLPPPQQQQQNNNNNSSMMMNSVMNMAAPPMPQQLPPLQWNDCNSIKNKMVCVPLQPSCIPDHFQGDMSLEAVQTLLVPDFHNLLNFPPAVHGNTTFGRKPLSAAAAATSTSRADFKRCAMCGVACPFGKQPATGGGGGSSSTNHRATIPKQNKGICTACDVKVWVIVKELPPVGVVVNNGSSSGGNNNNKKPKQLGRKQLEQQGKSCRNNASGCGVRSSSCCGMQIKWCKGCKNFRPWAAFGTKGRATKCMSCRERQTKKYARARQELLVDHTGGGGGTTSSSSTTTTTRPPAAKRRGAEKDLPTTCRSSCNGSSSNSIDHQKRLENLKKSLPSGTHRIMPENISAEQLFALQEQVSTGILNGQDLDAALTDIADAALLLVCSNYLE